MQWISCKMLLFIYHEDLELNKSLDGELLGWESLGFNRGLDFIWKLNSEMYIWNQFTKKTELIH